MPGIISGQEAGYTFNKIGLENGLHDGLTRCIGQDKYGYIWIGSVGGVGKFDGNSFIKYFHEHGKSGSPYNTQCRSLLSDKKGRMWVGFENGLMQYDFTKDAFIPILFFKDKFIASLSVVDGDLIAVGTRKGLFIYNAKEDKTIPIKSLDKEVAKIIENSNFSALSTYKEQLYAGSSNGLLIINIKTHEAKMPSNSKFKGKNIMSLATDVHGKIWICSNSDNILMSWDTKKDTISIYDDIFDIGNEAHPFYANGVAVDNQNNVWVTSAQNGLFRYDDKSNNFTKILRNLNIHSSPSENFYRCIFKDNKGWMWLGMKVEGINYFNPEPSIFTTILPFPASIQENLSIEGRAVTIDKSGFYWFGNHDGVTRYDHQTSTYKVFRNEKNKKKVLHSNTVKSIHCDRENNIWIGTGNGVNKYISKTGKMTFIDQKDLPTSFYNSINEDKTGNLWFCTNDSATLYTYNLKTKKYSNIASHPVLKKFVRYTPVSYFIEDSKGRYWISFSRKAVVSYDTQSNALKYYSATDSSTNRITSNLVFDIKEDKDGVIWLAGQQGLSSIDTRTNTIHNYTYRKGLPGSVGGPLCIDSKDRIWAGISGGLTMIGEDRKTINYFNKNNGLSSVGFPEHAGIMTPDQKIILPSYLGYLHIDPERYTSQLDTFPYYITSSNIMDEKAVYFHRQDTLIFMHLNHNETSFKIHFTALNYKRPDLTRYAYKLEGFDNRWQITENPAAMFTNIPSGDYTLKMVAYDINDDFTKLTPKVLNIHIDTVFYKTRLFIAVLLIFLASILYYAYQNRINQKLKVFDLQSKTQKLEKEKAIAMFDNLKQQLNPHFLFNSLSSLSGLIEWDAQVASKFLNQLSVIYRYILKNAENETVLLQDEILFATMYVDLQKTRFNEGLVVNVDVAEEFYDKLIAPVTVQNMIENAIKHNIIDKKRPLVIDIFVDDNEYLVIRNNLQKKSVVETSNQKGLQQFISLYQYMTSKPVIIESQNPTHFIIKIPLI